TSNRRARGLCPGLTAPRKRSAIPLARRSAGLAGARGAAELAGRHHLTRRYRTRHNPAPACCGGDRKTAVCHFVGSDHLAVNYRIVDVDLGRQRAGERIEAGQQIPIAGRGASTTSSPSGPPKRLTRTTRLRGSLTDRLLATADPALRQGGRQFAATHPLF